MTGFITFGSASRRRIAHRLAEGAGGLDVLLRLLRQHLPAHQAEELDPGLEGQREDDDPEAGAEDRHHADGEDEHREGEQEVGNPADHRVQRAAVVRRNRAEQHPNHRREEGGEHADRDRNPRAVDDPAEKVAPDRIAAQDVPIAAEPGRWCQPLGELALVDAVRRDGGREDRGQDVDQDDHATEQRRRVVEQLNGNAGQATPGETQANPSPATQGCESPRRLRVRRLGDRRLHLADRSTPSPD